MPKGLVRRIQQNYFLVGLVLAVIAAYFFPAPGSHGSFLHPEWVSNFGIALILFSQGISLPLEKVKSGLRNWRLHAIIQLFTFVFFPAVGLALQFLIPLFWANEPAVIQDGFLYLCVLPSTISTSVVLTSVARGNTAGALLNAALSNIMGVVLTPLLVRWLMQATGQNQPFGPLILQITALTLLPFAAGMLIRPRVRTWIDGQKLLINALSNAVILFIVYTAFCDSFSQKVWSKFGPYLTFSVLLWVIILFAAMSLLIGTVCRFAGLTWEDQVAAYFCSVKKTLAMGVPLAKLIFGSRADLTLILLPIMFYHPLQLFVNGLLAHRWAVIRQHLP